MIDQFIKITVAFIVFAIIHSLLAVPAAKARIQRAMGGFARWYRLGYNLVSLITLGIIVILFPPTGELLYRVPPPWSWLMRVLQVAAAIVFLRALKDFNTRDFLGLSAAGDDSEKSTEPLSFKGMFRYCRHPMYTASSVFLLAEPNMTIGFFAYTVNIILYFLVGSIFEEKHLEERFGRTYVEYKKAVPKFIPRLERSRLDNHDIN